MSDSCFRIAELNVRMKPRFPQLLGHVSCYRTEPFSSTDIEVVCSRDQVEQFQKKYPEASEELAEYLDSGFQFYKKLLDFNGFMLHASAVAYEENAYLFSAPCQTGKSTHVENWCRYFGVEKTQVINDDKPAIRQIDGRFWACGTPWSGKSDKNLNIKVPISAIAFIEQAPENWIRPLTTGEAVFHLLDQMIRFREPENLEKLFALLDELVKLIPIYQMGCTPNMDSVQLAYEAMKRSSS